MKFILALAVVLAVTHAALPSTKTAKVSKIIKKPVVLKKVSLKRSIVKMMQHLLNHKQGPNGGSSGSSSDTIQQAEAAICAYGDMGSGGGGSGGGGSSSACGALAPMCTTDSQGKCSQDPNYHCQYPKLKALVISRVKTVLKKCTGPTCSKGCRSALLKLQGIITAIQSELQSGSQGTTTDMSKQQTQSGGKDLPMFLKSMQVRFKAVKKNKKTSYHKGDNLEMESLVCFLEVAAETKLEQVGGDFSNKYNATTCDITQADADAATAKEAKAIHLSETDTGSEPKSPEVQEPKAQEPKKKQGGGKKAVKTTDQQQQEKTKSTKTVDVVPELVQQKNKKNAQKTVLSNKKKVLAANKQTIRAAPASDSSSAKAAPAASSSAKAAPAAKKAPVTPLPAAKKPKEVVEKDKNAPAEAEHHKSAACTFTPVNTVFTVIAIYITALFA